MLEQNNIIKTHVICEHIDFSMKRENITSGRVQVNVQIKATWRITQVKADHTGAKYQIIYDVESNIFRGKIEAIVLVDFNRAMEENELATREAAKLCVLPSVEYVSYWIADISSKMGVSPFVIPTEVIKATILQAPN